MKFPLCMLFLGLLPRILFAQSDVSALRWVETGGPPGGAVPSVCVDSSGRLFIGTEAAGVFESTNEGDLWYTRNTGLSTFHMLDLEASPRGYIFAITYDGGVYRFYHDDNPVWTTLDTTLTFGSIASMACAPNGDVFLGTGNYGILRSTDNGITWDHPDSGIAAYVTGFPILTAASGGLIALGHYRDSTKRDVYNIYRSTNDGNTWQLLANAPGSSRPTAFLALNTDTLFYGNLSGMLYRSTDAGLDWGIVFKDSGAFAIYNIVRSRANGHLFLRTDDGTLYRSTDVGTNWDSVSTDTLGGNIYATAIDSSGAIFVGTDFEGMLRSSDEGTNFSTINAQISASLIYDVAVSKSSDMYAVTEAMVWRSSDRGNSWTRCNVEVNSPFSDPAFAIDSANDLYLGNSTGVWVSRDSGQTWNDTLALELKQNNNACYQIAVDRFGNVFAATHAGLFESTNHGSSWKLDSTGIGTTGAEVIVIGRDGNLYMGQEGTSLFYRSTDDGYYWTPFSNTQSGIAAVRGDELFFAASGREVFRSMDNAATWQTVWVPDSLDARGVFRIYLDSHDNLFAATDSGIYVSTDAGNSWHFISQGFQDPSATRLSAATDLCEDTRTGLYYAASRGQGVFRSIPNSSVSNNAMPEAPSLDVRIAPNPIRQSAVVSFSLDRETDVRLELRNALGALVRSRDLQSLQPGEHHIALVVNGIPSGSYLCLLRVGPAMSTKWLTVLR